VEESTRGFTRSAILT